ncbi:MAG: hypothetical protein MUP76_06890 [Acidimicrobiia bacterium]|nr:hypothetical protein [Acidimicrobiia bacterium]
MLCVNGHPMAVGERFCSVCGATAASGPGQPPPPPGGVPQQFAAAPPPIPPRTGMWVILGTVVLAVAAVAIVFMVTNGKDDGGNTAATLAGSTSTSQAPGAVSSSTSSTPPSATSSSVPATTPVTTIPLPGPVTVSAATWETVAGGVLGGDGGQSLSDVAAIGDGYVAVGASTQAVVWTSPDGVAWTAQPAPALEGAQLLHIESAPDGSLVGVGRNLTVPPVFAAWTSTDGVTWIPQAPPGGVLPPGVQQVSDLAAYPGGYVAVGLIDNNGDMDAAWWTSSDAVTWTAGTIAEPGVQQMLGVAISDGVMVAAGESRPNTGIWRATPGGTFTRVDSADLTTAVSDHDPSYADARVFAWDVAAGGPGFVAVGADQTTAGTSAAAVWTSTNGKKWTRFGNETEYTPNMLHANFAGRAPWTVMDTITESSGTLIVVGRTGAPADPDLIVWESVDGSTWRQGAVGIIPGRQYAVNALARDGRLIVVGEQGTYGAGDGAVWVATPDPDAPQIGTWREVPRFEWASSGYAGSATIFDDRIIAVGQSSTDPLIWESADGIDWTALPAPPTQAGQAAGLSSITSIDGVLFATGQDPDAAIWWSEDLSAWHRAATPNSPGSDIDGIWQSGGQLIAFSPPGDPPLIWLSPDGRTWTDTAIAQILDPDSWVAGVGEIGGRLVLAVGEPSGAMQVWVSSDGNVWTRLPDDPVFDGFWPQFAITFGDRMVVSGNTDVNGMWSNAMLATTDLESWDLIAIEADTAVEYESNLGMSVVGSRLYLNGFVIDIEFNSYPALWSTGDLVFWTRFDPLPIGGVANDQIVIWGKADDVVLIGDRLVAVGWSSLWDGGDWHAAAWTSDNP